jgi:hypothetical protein
MIARALNRPGAVALPALMALLAAALLVVATPPAPARAQASGTQGVPDVPSGNGTLQGVVRHPDGPGKTEGLAIALYALDADGTPSLRSTKTDASGAFRFENIASASGVTYLVGARYRNIPYGTRVRFDAGDASARPVLEVVIDVADPTSDVSTVSVVESRVEVGWMGDSLAIQESHLLNNSGDSVVYVEAGQRPGAKAPFVGYVPEAATNFTPAFGSLESDFERSGDTLRYFGSIHPGEQSVSYRYRLPASSERIVFESRFPSGSQAVTFLIPVADPEATATGAERGDEVEIGGERFRSFIAGPLEPGATVALELPAPEQREDPDALEITMANAWLELDDTALTVMSEYTLEVAPGGRLVGTPDAPLLKIGLPAGAELMGLSPNASRLGLQRSEPIAGNGGGIDLLGPIPAGQTQLSYRYRIPATPSGTELVLRFPRHVPQLNVLIADTGVVVEDQRMHRRRPTQSGTRLYLHREAFQVSPDEAIELRLTPLEGRSLTPRMALVPVLLAAAFAAWFLVSPLRSGRSASASSSIALSTRDRRELVYEDIRDLDHDFETGKVSQADHIAMRAELRQRAIELMRLETGDTAQRESAAGGAVPSAAQESAALAAPAASPAPPASGAARFCTACGGPALPSWAFCARCGEALPVLGDADA